MALTHIIQTIWDILNLFLLPFWAMYYATLAMLFLITFFAYTTYHVANFVSVSSKAFADFLNKFLVPPFQVAASDSRRADSSRAVRTVRYDRRSSELSAASSVRQTSNTSSVDRRAEFFLARRRDIATRRAQLTNPKFIPGTQEALNLDNDLAMSVPRWIAVDDTDASIQYIGSGWFQDQGSQNEKGHYGASYRSTLHGTQTSASLAFTFSGTQVRVFGFNNIRNDSGVYDPGWECFVDNISIGRSSPSMVVGNYWTLCEHHQLVDDLHVMTVNATVSKGQTFWLDQIQYVPSSYIPLNTAAVLVDNADSAIDYGEGWENLGNFCNSTNTANSTMVFPFNGVSLSWYAYIPQTLQTPTTASYSVDGKHPVNFQLNGIPADSNTQFEYNRKMFETPQYEPGQHELVVTYLGNSSTTPLTLDWLVVQNATGPCNGSPTPNHGNANERTASSHSKTGPIVGGVIGSLALIGIAIAVFFFFPRRGRKTKQREFAEQDILLDIDDGATIEPFHVLPSVQPGAASGFYANRKPQGSMPGTFHTAHNGSNHSQITSELNSVVPPSLTSASSNL